MSTYKIPPQPLIAFDQTLATLLSETQSAIAKSRQNIEKLVACDPEKATFSNILLPLAANENQRINTKSLIAFFKYVSPSADLRKASAEADKLWRAYNQELSTRKDIFQLVRAVQEKGEEVGPEESKYLQKVYAGFISYGFDVPDEKKERFEKIRKRADDVAAKCKRNVGEERGGIWFAAEELIGIPADILSGFVKGEEGSENDGMFKVGFKKVQLNNALTYAANSETRRRMFIGNENKCPDNVPLFKELVVLREEIARLLGYASHVDFKMQDRMLTAGTVREFLDDLMTQMTPRGEKDMLELRKVKGAYLREIGVRVAEIDDKIYLWDELFYTRLMQENLLAFDENIISEYFPLDKTLHGLLNIFERLFGIVFVEVPSHGGEKKVESAWHPDVVIMAVWDEEAIGGGFLGYLYLDLLSRDGKMNGAFNATFQAGFSKEDGTQHYPSSALVTPFDAPAPTKPTLLRHSNVVTLFHELGHGIHYLVGRTRFARFYGTSTSRDFVEIPSKMLENWCWKPTILQALSCHYSHLSSEYLRTWETENANAKRPAEKASLDLLESICKTRNLNIAFATLRQLHLSLFDIIVHSASGPKETERLDLGQIYNRLRRDATGLCGPEEYGEDNTWGCGHARFQHLFHGYDAAYYTYPIAGIYARDMFETRFGIDPMNAGEGRRYRETVLAKGGSFPETDLIKEFLGGRMPDGAAFSRSLDS